MAELRVDISFTNNMVLILDCLPSDEMQTGKHLFEALRDLPDIKLTGYCNYLKVASRSEFVEALAKVLRLCEKNWPILHIEAHGDEQSGLLVGGNESEAFAWDDLANFARECNAACGHNFGLVLASCHGRYLESRVRATEGAPFHFLVSFEGKILAGDAERHMVRFYSMLFRTASIDESFGVLPPEASVFRSHEYFLREYGRHYKRALMGKGRELTIERQVSQMMKMPLVAEYLGVQKVRAIAKRVTELSEDKYIEQSHRFFHGGVPVPYWEFVGYLRSLPPAPDGFYEKS